MKVVLFILTAANYTELC